jgi:hypothetical protein
MAIDRTLGSQAADTPINGMPPVVASGLDWVKDADDPAETKAFCRRHGISDAVTRCIAHLRAEFKTINSVRICPRTDPENSEEKLIISINVPGSADGAISSYERFLDRWAGSEAWDAIQRICVSYTVG